MHASGKYRRYVQYRIEADPAPNPQARSLFPYMIADFYDRSIGFADYHAFQLADR